MPKLTLRLLGAPGIERDGAPVAMDTRKATALLAFLAVTGRSHARETLAALLWPEYDDEHARAALRRTLSTLRAALNETHMASDRETVGLIPGVGLWAVIGRSCDLEALLATRGRSDEETVSALEILANQGIVREVPEETGAAPRYDFTHEKLRAGL